MIPVTVFRPWCFCWTLLLRFCAVGHFGTSHQTCCYRIVTCPCSSTLSWLVGSGHPSLVTSLGQISSFTAKLDNPQIELQTCLETIKTYQNNLTILFIYTHYKQQLHTIPLCNNLHIVILLHSLASILPSNGSGLSPGTIFSCKITALFSRLYRTWLCGVPAS